MNRPYTFINIAMTADGKIDTSERKGSTISSNRDKERVDQLRATADGILVGGRTLLEEQPRLTVKSEALREGRIQRGLSPNPIKVGVVTFTTSLTSIRQLDSLRALGVEVFVADAPRVDLNQMMITLKKIGVDHLMVEGGGRINFELLRLRLVDELAIYIAPMIFGGASAPPLAVGPGLKRDAAIELKLMDVEKWEDGGVFLRYKII